jgi:hypothetical protein
VISPAKNLWHCLGARQAGGTVIDWVLRAEGVSFRHAVELLRSDAAFTAGKPVRQSTVPKLPRVAFDADDCSLPREDARAGGQVKPFPTRYAHAGKDVTSSVPSSHVQNA